MKEKLKTHQDDETCEFSQNGRVLENNLILYTILQYIVLCFQCAIIAAIKFIQINIYIKRRLAVSVITINRIKLFGKINILT